MPSLDLDKLAVALADEFKRRDMRKHLDLLRAWYRGFRQRKHAALWQKEPPWTEEMVIGWLCNFGIPPFEAVLPVLARGVRACACNVKEAGMPAVACVFPPNGCVRECNGCGARWLEKSIA